MTIQKFRCHPEFGKMFEDLYERVKKSRVDLNGLVTIRPGCIQFQLSGEETENHIETWLLPRVQNAMWEMANYIEKNLLPD